MISQIPTSRLLTIAVPLFKYLDEPNHAQGWSPERRSSKFLYRPIILSRAATSVLGPCDNLLDETSANNPEVFNNGFSVESQMNFFRVDGWLRHSTDHARYLHTRHTCPQATDQHSGGRQCLKWKKQVPGRTNPSSLLALPPFPLIHCRIQSPQLEEQPSTPYSPIPYPPLPLHSLALLLPTLEVSPLNTAGERLGSTVSSHGSAVGLRIN